MVFSIGSPPLREPAGSRCGGKDAQMCISPAVCTGPYFLLSFPSAGRAGLLAPHHSPARPADGKLSAMLYRRRAAPIRRQESWSRLPYRDLGHPQYYSHRGDDARTARVGESRGSGPASGTRPDGIGRRLARRRGWLVLPIPRSRGGPAGARDVPTVGRRSPEPGTADHAGRPRAGALLTPGAPLGEADLVSAVNQLTIPTLYLAPRHGDMAPDPSDVTNPLVRLVLIDGVGHCVRRDAPETYHGLVDPFIEETFGNTSR